MKKSAALSFVADKTPAARAARRACVAEYGNVPVREAEVLVALGGDGLMLHTIHRAFGRVPIFGMNVGTVGFLMNEFAVSGLRERIGRAEEVTLHPLRMTATTRTGRRKTALAVNEVSLLRNSGQMAKIEVAIDGVVRLESLFCDGVLVSTAAGSTAYNLSAHGPILPLRSELLALTPISAFRPRRWRGAVLPSRAQIRFRILEPDKRPVSATADHREIRDIVGVRIAEATDKRVALLFDPEHDLEERILVEQFAT